MIVNERELAILNQVGYLLQILEGAAGDTELQDLDAYRVVKSTRKLFEEMLERAKETSD